LLITVDQACGLAEAQLFDSVFLAYLPHKSTDMSELKVDLTFSGPKEAELSQGFIPGVPRFLEGRRGRDRLGLLSAASFSPLFRLSASVSTSTPAAPAAATQQQQQQYHIAHPTAAASAAPPAAAHPRASDAQDTKQLPRSSSSSSSSTVHTSLLLLLSTPHRIKLLPDSQAASSKQQPAGRTHTA
jgi:hypothetical protein